MSTLIIEDDENEEFLIPQPGIVLPALVMPTVIIEDDELPVSSLESGPILSVPTIPMVIIEEDDEFLVPQPGNIPASSNLGKEEKIKFPKVSRYTLPIFLERAAIVHGDRFNYSEVTEGCIAGARSDVIVTCNGCAYRFSTTIVNHINHQSGCSSCSGKLKWDLPRFLEAAQRVHNGKFYYGNVTSELLKNSKAHIPIQCRECSHSWLSTVNSHIIHKTGCANCAGQLKLTLETFLESARKVHKNKFDYSNVRPEHINGNKSYVPIRCSDCAYSWTVQINSHLNGTGCPSCSDNVRWTLDRFLKFAHEIYQSRFDYSRITEGHIKGHRSHVPITCLRCTYEWEPQISDHITQKRGCPDCNGCAPLTYDRLMKRLIDTHGEKYDYSHILEGNITDGYQSEINVICNACRHCWSPSITNHLNNKTGCPRCCNSRGYSEAQIKWLNDIMVNDNIVIQTALSPEGEHNVKGIGKVDGYCYETNTIYEYHGSFWHGDPRRFPQDKLHPTVKNKTYGDLYMKTIARDQRIRDLGYNLVTKWESD